MTAQDATSEISRDAPIVVGAPDSPSAEAPAETKAASARSDWEGWIAPIVAAVALALPAVLARFPPMTDYPLHVGQVALLHDFGNPVLEPPGLYVLNLGHPNQLFHLTAAALSFLVGVDVSCKIVLALIQTGIILAGARLAAYLGVSRWSALLLAPIAIGWTFFWGLVTNMLGIALFLAALPTLDRVARRPSLRGAAISSGWLLLLYAAHESAMVVACSAILVFTLGYPLRNHLRDAALRVAPIVFAAVLFVLQLLLQAAKFDKSGTPPIEWHTLDAKIRSLAPILTGTVDDVSKWGLVVICYGAVLFFAVSRFALRSRSRRTVTEWTYHLRFELVAVVNLLAYFVMPFGFAKGTMFNHRFFHFAYCLFAITCTPHLVRRPFRAIDKLVTAAVTFAVLFVHWPQFVDSDEIARSLDKLLVQMADGSAVTIIEADRSSNRGFAAGSQISRALVAHGGRVQYSLATSVIAPVRFAPTVRWSSAERRTLTNTVELIPDVDLRLFRYVLVHSNDTSVRFVTALALEPEARFVDTAGEWTLMESRLPLISVASPEPPLPKPRPESMVKRMQIRLPEMQWSLATSITSDAPGAPPTP